MGLHEGFKPVFTVTDKASDFYDLETYINIIVNPVFYMFDKNGKRTKHTRKFHVHRCTEKDFMKDEFEKRFYNNYKSYMIMYCVEVNEFEMFGLKSKIIYKFSYIIYLNLIG